MERAGRLLEPQPAIAKGVKKGLTVMLAAVLAGGTALAATGDVRVTVLPRPPFTAPATNPAGAAKLVLVSSRPHPPTIIDDYRFGWIGSIPNYFGGYGQANIIRQPGAIFALYGSDPGSARYLLAFDANGRKFHYGFDFGNYVWPPRIAPGEREFGYEQVVYAREAGGVLYVENAHSTYARSSYGLNAYVTALDLKSRKRLWRSPALVANAQTFVLAGDYLVTGYGFTAERDYLYLLDRRTGRVLDRLLLPSAPETIARHGDMITVRTYDHGVVVRLTQ